MVDTNYISYGLLARNQVIAKIGLTRIIGNLGSNLSVEGTGTVVVTGQTNIGEANTVALEVARSDYVNFSKIPPTSSSDITDIGGMTFTKGIYEFTNSSVTIGTIPDNNIVTIDGPGVFIFQFPNGDLSTDSALAPVSISLINGASVAQLFWLVSGSVNFQTIGGNITHFMGLLFLKKILQ